MLWGTVPLQLIQTVKNTSDWSLDKHKSHRPFYETWETSYGSLVGKYYFAQWYFYVRKITLNFHNTQQQTQGRSEGHDITNQMTSIPDFNIGFTLLVST